MTNIYFVRHAQSCSNIATIDENHHPPLSYKGIQQAVYLGIDNEIIDQEFEEYYCSPSLRTIMTAYLALRDTKKKITLKLDSNLIENRYFKPDNQNAVVKRKNLEKMIDYIKLWFQTKYFDNFIDYKFIDLIYDLVLLLYINNKLEQYKNILQTLINNNDKTKTRPEILKSLIDLLQNNEDMNLNSKPIYIYQSNLSKLSFLIYYHLKTKLLNNKYDIILFLNDNKFEIFIDENSNKTNKLSDIIISLTKFLDKDYYFNKNIEIEYNYYEKHPDTDKKTKHKIQNFIDSLDKNKNILCFSHGATLTQFFNLKPFLKNTEIVCYNTETKQNKRIKRDEIADIPENLENICGNILHNPDYRMFYVINKYFNDHEYKVNDDNEVLELYKT